LERKLVIIADFEAEKWAINVGCEQAVSSAIVRTAVVGNTISFSQEGG
jgi:hypothetical protein